MVLVVPEQSQRPYRFGMTLLCVGALFNWLGLADTYSDPVPAIRYIGVGLIAAGASLICMAMCFWMRNIHDPNSNIDFDVSSDPIHVISSDPTLEKPPDYSTVVDVPPCYEDAIKLSSTPIIFPLKHAPTSNIQVMSQNVEPIDTSSKNVATERNNSSQSDESCNSHDFAVPSVNSGQREKSEDVSSSQNSSQNENAFTKVFRKSIRGIRRLRSGSDDSSNSCGHSSNLENGSICQARGSTESTKVDR